MEVLTAFSHWAVVATSLAPKKKVSNVSTEVHALFTCAVDINASVHHSWLWNMRWPCTCEHAQCHNQPKFSISMHSLSRSQFRLCQRQIPGARPSRAVALHPPTQDIPAAPAPAGQKLSLAALDIHDGHHAHALVGAKHLSAAKQRAGCQCEKMGECVGWGWWHLSGANNGKGRLKSNPPIRTPRAHDGHLRTWAGHVACRVGGGWELSPGG